MCTKPYQKVDKALDNFLFVAVLKIGKDPSFLITMKE